MNARVLPVSGPVGAVMRTDALSGRGVRGGTGTGTCADHHSPIPGLGNTGFDERCFRRALGRFATGVVVISTGSDERMHAMTANAFMSGSLKPPLIVVSVGHRARMHERLMESHLFGVSVLSDEQEPHSRHFGGDEQAAFTPRFVPVDGLPEVMLLEHAVARFAARIVDRHPCGDHTLFIGEVLVFSLDEQAPLVFFGGRYASVAADR